MFELRCGDLVSMPTIIGSTGTKDGSQVGVVLVPGELQANLEGKLGQLSIELDSEV